MIDQEKLDPTESDMGRSLFLLSCRGDRSGYYRAAHNMGPHPNAIQFPCRTMGGQPAPETDLEDGVGARRLRVGARGPHLPQIRALADEGGELLCVGHEALGERLDEQPLVAVLTGVALPTALQQVVDLLLVDLEEGHDQAHASP